MSPLKRSNNFAARMGRWSAGHRKTAVLGWLAFVIAAAVIGGAIGTKQLDQDELGIGESGRAQEMIDRGAYRDAADETVLVSSESLKTLDRYWKQALDENRTIAFITDAGHRYLLRNVRNERTREVLERI